MVENLWFVPLTMKLKFKEDTFSNTNFCECSSLPYYKNQDFLPLEKCPCLWYYMYGICNDVCDYVQV